MKLINLFCNSKDDYQIKFVSSMLNLLLIKQKVFLDNHKDIKDKIESHLKTI